MSRKTIIFFILLAGVVVLVVGFYLLFFTKPTTQQTNTENPYQPFGEHQSSGTGQTGTTTTSTDNNIPDEFSAESTSPLFELSSEPVAGAAAQELKSTQKNGTSTPLVHYMERATGHTFEFNALTRSIKQLSNTTVPTIYNALWSGSSVVLQYLNSTGQTIKTFSASLSKASVASSSSPFNLSGIFLQNDLYSIALSPTGTRLFSLASGEEASGVISTIDGTKKTQILNFPFNEWLSQWPNETTIALTTKASANVSGYLYFLKTDGTFTKVFGDIAGLTTLTNPSLTYVLFSSGNNSGIATGIYDIKNNTLSTFDNLATLSEKCVWSTKNQKIAYCAVPLIIPSGNYPDDWYQGKVSFIDNIYKVDLEFGSVNLLYKLPQEQSIDATNLFLDAKEENLYFTNKANYSLWGLRIKDLTPSI